MCKKLKEWLFGGYKMSYEFYTPLPRNDYIIDYIIRKYINHEEDYIAAYEEQLDKQEKILQHAIMFFDDVDAEMGRDIQANYYLIILLSLVTPKEREKWYKKINEPYIAKCIKDLVSLFNRTFQVNTKTGVLEKIIKE